MFRHNNVIDGSINGGWRPTIHLILEQDSKLWLTLNQSRDDLAALRKEIADIHSKADGIVPGLARKIELW